MVKNPVNVILKEKEDKKLCPKSGTINFHESNNSKSESEDQIIFGINCLNIS